MKTEKDDLIVPMHSTDRDGDLRCDGKGLTKREYFAAHALTGILADPSSDDLGHPWIASAAVNLADELVEALNKESE